MDDNFRFIPNYEGYEINIYGQVKRLSYIDKRGWKRQERFLKTQVIRDPNGHVSMKVQLYGYCEYIAIAHFLLCAFVRSPNLGEIARHLDDNGENNDLLNLAWGSRKDNILDAIRNGLRPDFKGLNNPASKLNMRQVILIKDQYDSSEHQKSVRTLARKFGVEYRTIERALKL